MTYYFITFFFLLNSYVLIPYSIMLISIVQYKPLLFTNHSYYLSNAAEQCKFAMSSPDFLVYINLSGKNVHNSSDFLHFLYCYVRYKSFFIHYNPIILFVINCVGTLILTLKSPAVTCVVFQCFVTPQFFESKKLL